MFNPVAPIALFAYKRLDHLKKCIESLKENPQAARSSLVVFSDGPKVDADRDAVAAVRQYLDTLQGFESIRIVARDRNLGLSASIQQGVSEMVNAYQKVIVLEDDLLVSPYFLQYMNDALTKYEHEQRVISIHGYCYPVSVQLPETFFLRGADCWGWATWKRGWDLLETDGTRLLNEIRESGEERRFNFDNSYPYTTMLQDQIAGRNKSWAILWYASAFVKNKLTLYPGKPVVHNMGNDSSGTHSKTTQSYDVDIARHAVDVNGTQPALHDDLRAVKAFADFFKGDHSLIGRLKGLLKKMLRWN